MNKKQKKILLLMIIREKQFCFETVLTELGMRDGGKRKKNLA